MDCRVDLNRSPAAPPSPGWVAKAATAPPRRMGHGPNRERPLSPPTSARAATTTKTVRPSVLKCIGRASGTGPQRGIYHEGSDQCIGLGIEHLLRVGRDDDAAFSRTNLRGRTTNRCRRGCRAIHRALVGL